MSDAALFDEFEAEGFDDLDEDASLDALDADEGFEGLDEFGEDLDAGDELEAALDGLDDDALDDIDAYDALDDDLDDLDEFGDYALDEESDLYLPGATRLMSGPAATAVMARLHPAVMDSLDAD